MCGTKPMDAPSITIVCPWSMSYCTDTFVHTCAYAYTRMRTHADTHEHTHACTQVCGARMHACTHRFVKHAMQHCGVARSNRSTQALRTQMMRGRQQLFKSA